MVMLVISNILKLKHKCNSICKSVERSETVQEFAYAGGRMLLFERNDLSSTFLNDGVEPFWFE